jgi:hypothetical protein
MTLLFFASLPKIPNALIVWQNPCGLLVKSSKAQKLITHVMAKFVDTSFVQKAGLFNASSKVFGSIWTSATSTLNCA